MSGNDTADVHRKMTKIDPSTLRPMAGLPPMETARPSPRAKPMSVMRAILGDCMCEPFPFTDNRGLSQSSQFVELHGVECISLGAVVDELSPEQRIRETLEQLTAEPKRMISIGYLVDEEVPRASANQVVDGETTKLTETIDLDVWRKNYPDDKNMSKPVAQTIKHIEVNAYTYQKSFRKQGDLLTLPLFSFKQLNQFGAAMASFEKDLERQKAHPKRNNNSYLSGITANNMAVVYLFAGRSDEAFALFQEAVALKRVAFGNDHPQVAVSYNMMLLRCCCCCSCLVGVTSQYRNCVCVCVCWLHCLLTRLHSLYIELVGRDWYSAFCPGEVHGGKGRVHGGKKNSAESHVPQTPVNCNGLKQHCVL